MWSFVTVAQGKEMQASFHQVAESKPQSMPGNSINSLFLGPGLGSRAVIWHSKVGPVGGHPTFEYLPARPAISEGPCPAALSHSFLCQTPGPALYLQTFCSSSLISNAWLLSLALVGHWEVLGMGEKRGQWKPVTTSLLSPPCGHSTAPSPPWAFS